MIYVKYGKYLLIISRTYFFCKKTSCVRRMYSYLSKVPEADCVCTPNAFVLK